MTGDATLPAEPDAQRRAPRNVAGLLMVLEQQRYSGALVVEGAPGGVIHLREGSVCAIETPACPGAELILVKSRRIADSQWTAARTTAQDGDADVCAALIGLGMLNAAELSVVTIAAVFDGAFALALHRPEGWHTDEARPMPPLVNTPGVDPQRLTATTSRRLTELTELWGPPARLARAAVHPSSRAGAASTSLLPRYRDILLCADGRRTPRDIAFALGRGLFPVMLDLARMSSRQLLADDGGPAQAAPVPSLAPRAPGMTPPNIAPAALSPLPRRSPAAQSRRRGASGTAGASGTSG
jgi:hypothetical protein